MYRIRDLFRRRDPIPAPWLNALARFRNGFRSITSAIEVNHRADGGCDLDFHPEAIAEALDIAPVALALITTQSAGSAICLGSVYANGAGATATQTGATIRLHAAPAVVPPVNTTWLIVRRLLGTDPAEWEAVPNRLGTAYKDLVSANTLVSGILKYQLSRLTLDYNSGGETIPLGTDHTGSISVVKLDGDGHEIKGGVIPELKVKIDENSVTVCSAPTYNTSTGTWGYYTVNLSLEVGAGGVKLVASDATPNSLITGEAFECPTPP